MFSTNNQLNRQKSYVGIWLFKIQPQTQKS
jgi:hypothetical protein